MPPERRERLTVMPVTFFFNLLVAIFVIHAIAPANHVYGIVVQQLELAVQFRDIIARGGSRIKYLVFETAENAQDMPCPLR